MKTLAVLLAGEFRTWEKCSQYMFRFFDVQAPQFDRIDYFFATWATSSDMPGVTITDNDVRSKFSEHGKNLVAFNIVQPIGRKSSTFYNQAYLAKMVNIRKRENEIMHNFVYDQVVETRPDIYMRSAKLPWRLMRDYEVCNCNHYNKNSAGFNEIDDVYYRTNSFTNDIIANRYWYRKPRENYVHIGMGAIHNWHNHHCMIAEYLTLNAINFVREPNSADYLGPHIAVRRQAIDVDFDNGRVEDLKEKHQPNDQHSWQKEDKRLTDWH